MTVPPNLTSPRQSATVKVRPVGRNLGLVFVSTCLLLIVVAYAFTRPLQDFVEYWAAGHLLAAHNNPYSLDEMFRFERALGWNQPIPLIPLNPPWTLPLFAPFGLFNSYPLAWLTWVAILAALIALSSRILMDLYFGDIRLPEISDKTVYRCLFALSFYPVLLSLKFAQMAPLVLLGAAGFLFFERKEQSVLAGILFSLTTVKPNLVYLVWLALLFESFQRRRWKIIVAAATVIAAMLGTAIILDPHVLAQYRALVSTPLPRVLLPGVAGAIRTLFGGRDSFWLQYVPPVVGLIWLVFYWRRNRNNWIWTDHMPALVAGSILTTGYGWLFDQTLLAIPIIALAGKYAKEFGYLPRNMVFLYTALNVALILLAMASSPWGFVPAPIVIAFLLYREARKGNALVSGVRYSYVGS
jgi:hypothetical protein